MENYIESRVILGILCLIHIFAGYASQVSWGHIKRKTLNSVLWVELIAVTAYIIYDNFQAPPYEGWALAIIGYLVVYALILMTWYCYLIYTELDENQTYEMTIDSHVRFMNVDYFKGTVLHNNHKVEVYLPYVPDLDMSNEVNRKQMVKWDTVIRGLHILVKKA